MNRISDEIIMNYIQKQYDYLLSEYGSHRILGVFAQGRVNFGFAGTKEDIQVVGCYLPTFEELCSQCPEQAFQIVDEEKDINIKLTDIRYILALARQQKESVLEAVFTEYCIINPNYQKIFTETIYTNREAMFHCNKKARLECAAETALQEIEHYKQTKNIYSLFNACRKRIAATLYIAGTSIENCINLKKDYHINYLWNILDGKEKPDLDEVIEDLKKIKADCQLFTINKANEQLIANSITEIIRVSLNPVVPKEEFLLSLTDNEKEALQIIIKNLPEKEGNISISKLLTQTAVSRPVFKNLLRKMEDYNYAQIENQGVKGTYIKFLEENENI